MAMTNNDAAKFQFYEARKQNSMSRLSGSSSFVQEATLVHGTYGGAQSPGLFSNGPTPAKLKRVFNAQKTLDGLQNDYYKTNDLSFVPRNTSGLSIN